MATSKTRSEGFRAQTLEYIRKHPGVSSTDLRTKAAQFGTDEDKLSKTLWAMTACGLVVQKRIDPTKKIGPVQYWVPEAAPVELKAEIKLARQLQKSGLTMTELRKQQAGTAVAKKSSAGEKPEKAAPVSGKATRLSRKTPAAPVESIEAVAPQATPGEPTTAPGRTKRGPYKKTQANSSEQVSVQNQTPPVVTPISLEQPPVGAQPSLSEEPSQTKTKRGRPAAKPAVTANAAPVQPASTPPAAVPFAPVLDLGNLAAAFQPFAGALSDILANMVIGQTLQKVQQGLGGVSLALAQGTPQLAIPPAAGTPSPEDALNAFASLQAAAPAAYAAPTATHAPTAAHHEAPAAPGPVTSTAHDTAADGEAVSGATVDSDAQSTPRPVLHVASVREVTQKKPKVLVVGLLPNQAGIVQSEFYEAFDIRFAESDTPTKRLESMASDCDRVMLMTNFISHSTQDAVKKHPGFERIQGGVSKVKDRLTELFIASEEAA